MMQAPADCGGAPVLSCRTHTFSTHVYETHVRRLRLHVQDDLPRGALQRQLSHPGTRDLTMADVAAAAAVAAGPAAAMRGGAAAAAVGHGDGSGMQVRPTCGGWVRPTCGGWHTRVHGAVRFVTKRATPCHVICAAESLPVLLPRPRSMRAPRPTCHCVGSPAALQTACSGLLA